MLDDQNIRLQELAHKWLKGILNQSERLELDNWFNQSDDQPIVVPVELANTIVEHQDLLFSRIHQEIQETGRDKIYPLWKRITAAAAVLIIMTAAFFIYQQKTGLPDQNVRFANDIKAGGDKAYLTLSNGKRISLSSAVTGKLAEQAGVQVTKMADGQLMYQVLGKAEGSQLVYNTIETPRGGKYLVVLQDGSKVWLNAASRLKYPATFAGAKQRRIELTGEAYLEIARDHAHPFILATEMQDIEVLGTHFNVSSYPEDGEVKTTLLEGSVKLSAKSFAASKTLVPGEQAILSAGKITLGKNVDLEEVTAWKEGYFKFNDNLENIMTRVARWYDVEVVYQRKPDPNLFFLAEFSSSRNISALLKIIEATGSVHFKIEGRRIIVM